MKKTVLFKFIIIGLSIFCCLNAFSQVGLETLKTPRETLAKIKELNERCTGDPNGSCASSSVRLGCDPGKCGSPTAILRTRIIGDICRYEMKVFVDKFDSLGNPICCTISHVWGPMHCPVNQKIRNFNQDLVQDDIVISRFYPNPSKDLTNFDIWVSRPSRISIRVSNILGQTVHESSTIFNEGKRKLEVDVREFNEGTYFYTIFTDSNTKYQGKFSVTR